MMGFLELFRKKEPERVRFEELGAWLDKQVEEKNLGKRLEAARHEVNTLVAEAKHRLEQLEVAMLTNENIPVQEKQVMEGHRKSYIQKVARFLDSIELPGDFSEVGHYNARFSESLGRLASDTSKNHAVLKQFFEVEAGKVVLTVKSIEGALSRLQAEIEKEGVEMIKEAKIRLRQYHDDSHKKAKLQNELSRYTQELDGLRQKRDKIDGRLAELKKSREYGEFKEFIEEKKRVEESLGTAEQELITLFADLNRPLKKFTHNTPNEGFADNYIADPAGALLDDNSLRISDMLKKMVQDLAILELKDKQLEKTQAIVEKMTHEFLHGARMRMMELKERNNELAAKVNRSVVALNVSENESWVKSLEKKILEWETEVGKITHEIEQLNTGYLKQKAKEKAREVKKGLDIIDEE